MGGRGGRWRKQCIFGFEPDRNTEEIIVGLTAILQKGREWGDQFGATMISADVRSAFDLVTVPMVVTCMRYWRFPPSIIKAIIGESIDVKARAELLGYCSTGEFPFGRIKQGGMESPFCWNLILRTILDRLALRWAGRGVELSAVGHLAYMCWADNVYLVGRTRLEAQELFEDFTAEVQTLGLAWKESSLEILGAAGVTADLVTQVSHQSYVLRGVQQLMVLGALVSLRQSDVVEHRLSKATGAFWALKSALLCKHLPMHERLKILRTRVVPVALYGSAGWVWSWSLAARLHACENGLLRHMLRVVRAPSESFGQWRSRHTHAIREIYHGQGHYSLATLVLRRLFRFAGTCMQALCSDVLHCGRGASRNEQPDDAWRSFLQPNLTGVAQGRVDNYAAVAAAAVVATRSKAWWKHYQTTMTVCDPRNKTKWRHARPGPNASWEDVFHAWLGDNWMAYAADRQTWSSRLQGFLQKAYQYANTQSMEERFPNKKDSPATAATGSQATQDQPPRKKGRVVFREEFPWNSCLGGLKHRLFSH